MAAFDVAVNCPFIFFPMFYVAKEVIIPTNGVQRNGTNIIRHAGREWKENFASDNAACAAVWIPLHYVNFRVVPLKYRLPFMSCAGIVWSFALSKLQFG